MGGFFRVDNEVPDDREDDWAKALHNLDRNDEVWWTLDWNTTQEHQAVEDYPEDMRESEAQAEYLVSLREKDHVIFTFNLQARNDEVECTNNIVKVV